MLPDFIFIGPDKAGSTWLWKMLRQHPEIYVTPAKDIYYFDRNYHRGMKWYKSFFHGAAPSQIKGEFSHDYLCSEIAAARIKRDLPHVKLLVMLRDPPERAFSEFLFLKKHGLVDRDATLKETIAKHPEVIGGGMYGHCLTPYFHAFSRNQLFIGSYSDIAKSPDDLLAKICGFLGASSDFSFIGAGNRVLASARPRSIIVARAAKQAAIALRGMGAVRMVGRIKQIGVIEQLLYRRYGGEERPTISCEERAWLDEIYQDDLALLAGLLGDDAQCLPWM